MSILEYGASYMCFTFISCAEYYVRLVGDIKEASNILKGIYTLPRHELRIYNVHSSEFTHIS